MWDRKIVLVNRCSVLPELIKAMLTFWLAIGLYLFLTERTRPFYETISA